MCLRDQDIISTAGDQHDNNRSGNERLEFEKNEDECYCVFVFFRVETIISDQNKLRLCLATPNVPNVDEAP